MIYLGLLIGLLFATNFFQGIGNRGDDSHDTEAFRQLPIAYTRHADCRMECRTISTEEVEEALANGTINQQKSDPADTPCPTVALEDLTEDGQHIRVIFAHCPDRVKVVTAIDLNGEYDCHCP